MHDRATQHKHLKKFVLLACTLAGYFGYLSWKYDMATGGMVSALTWSFFVLCTPIADAGFLLDFPVRLITSIRMFITEIIVWMLAIFINLLTLRLNPEVYETTFLTALFYKILTTPFPYWGIIVLSGIGTFLSIHFGDKVMDAVSHKHLTKHTHSSRYRLTAMTLLMICTVLAYYYLLKSLGVTIPL